MSHHAQDLCPAAYMYGEDGYSCKFKEGITCLSFSAKNYIGCTIWGKHLAEGLCPHAFRQGHDFNACELAEDGTACPDATAKDFKNCDTWKTAQEKAPADGCEVIDLATRRRVMLTSDDGLKTISAAWTKIAAGIQELFIQWLESPEGQKYLTAIIAEAFKGTEGGG